MDRIERAKGMRRLAAPLMGGLAIVALAAAPAFAHTQISTADPSRHILLAAELATADATEAADLETLLDVEDAQDNSQTGDNQTGTEATDQSGTEATDQSGAQDQSGTDATDQSGDSQDVDANETDGSGTDPASTGADNSGGGSTSGDSNSGSNSGD